MLLKNKYAVVFGAGGSIGGAVARAFAREGAHVFLAGRTQETLDVVAHDIHSRMGRAETSIVDALDEHAVNEFLNTVVKSAGRVDICFNAISWKDVQGKPITEMRQDDFMQPIIIGLKTQFITSAAVGRLMQMQGSGVILMITATPAGKAFPQVGGFGPACSAVEGFMRNLASELGPSGVRVVCMRSAGSPDSEVFIEAVKQGGTPAKTEVDALIRDTMLRRLPLISEIGNAAVLLVSDLASAITGSAANVTCGTTRD